MQVGRGESAGWTRRSLLTGAVAASVVALGAACAPPAARRASPPVPRTALVYRGPAGCDGCAETLAERLGSGGSGLDVSFIGPGQDVEATPEALDGASLFVQPGGGDDIDDAASHFSQGFSRALRRFVHDGGRYLGVCMGAYLAGSDGFGLLSTSIEGAVGTPRFPVADSGEHLVEVAWNGTKRWTFFQEGALLPARGAEICARYCAGGTAAALYRVGKGRVGLIGPHPEADQTWFDEAGLSDPDGDDWRFARPLVDRLLA